MYQFDFKIRVRYADTDQMGIVYYGNFTKYYEIGRVETIRSLGVSYKELEEDHGVILPVLYLESRFKKPAKYDELLIIRSKINSWPEKLIQFDTEIINEAGEIINTAVVKLFFVDQQTGKRISCPDIVANKLKAHFA